MLVDQQIAQLALHKGMITPFVDHKVSDGMIASYGLSHCGYDVRLGPKVKLMKDTFAAEIDPADLDPSAFDVIDFAEIDGDWDRLIDPPRDVNGAARRRQNYVRLPPRSYALGYTMERFEMPNDVVGDCVGKSTYARCFSGSTRVALVDGTSISFEEMVERASKGDLFWGYSVGETGRIEVTLLCNPRLIGRDQLLEIKLDNGEVVQATPDHLFMRRDGRFIPASDLRVNDSLMPLYREVRRGYESVYQPLTGHLYPTHRLADEWNVRNEIYDDVAGTHRHHVDRNRRNNTPTNLVRMPASDHIRFHNALYYDGDTFDSEAHGAAVKAAYARLSSDPEWYDSYRRSQQRKVQALWTDPKYAAVRARLLESRRHVSDATRAKHSRAMLERFAAPGARERQSQKQCDAWARDPDRHVRQREVMRYIRFRHDVNSDAVVAALAEAGSLRGASRILDCDRAVLRRRFPDLIAPYKNHKVVRIRHLRGEHDVYCLSVPEAGNFALESGVFVHNCGVLINVTPLEPGWRGHLTIEISNSGPLPVRIYVGQGIAQIRFWRLDRVPMQIYQGKYQDQEAEPVGPRMGGVTQ